jgi:hypothetical protein
MYGSQVLSCIQFVTYIDKNSLCFILRYFHLPVLNPFSGNFLIYTVQLYFVYELTMLSITCHTIQLRDVILLLH